MPQTTIHWTLGEVSLYYAARVPHLKRRAKRWRAPCPLHRGTRDNFSVDPGTGRWFCFSKCGRGGDMIALEQEFSAADFVTARNNVFEIVGRAVPDDWSLRSREQRREYASRCATAERLAELARRWHRATVACLQSAKEAERVFSPAWASSCRALTTAERMGPREILEAYLTAARQAPAETARRIAWAEEKERDCARVTVEVVQLIRTVRMGFDAD
jgi:hypothetical protein